MIILYILTKLNTNLILKFLSDRHYLIIEIVDKVIRALKIL